MDLTERQKLLLKVIINEFIETADAVGSTHLPKKYGIDVSPATIRNEMVNLGEKGLIVKSHVSSGRVPTAAGYRYFINELLDDLEKLAVETEVRVRESIAKRKFDTEKLVFQAIKKLSDLTNSAGLAVFDERIYYTGLSQVMNLPDYQESHYIRNIVKALEDYEFFNNLFSSCINKETTTYETEKGRVCVLIGNEDIGQEGFVNSAIVYGKINLHGGQQAYMGIIGSSRMNYSMVIPRVSWMLDTVNTMTEAWH